MSMPLVFTPTEEIVTPQKWYHDLSQNASAYSNCFVRRITHVKNLNSSLLHEYLQVILEDAGSSSKDRTRVLTERQTEQDQVIIGRWSFGAKPSGKALMSSSSGSSSSGSGFFQRITSLFGGSASPSSSSSKDLLPLQLWSLTFDDNNLNVIALAEIMRTTSDRMGCYNLVLRNCYVFAKSVYETVLQKYKCQQNSWKFAHLQGTLPFLQLKTQEMKETAHQFDEELKKDFQWAPANEVEETLGVLYTAAIEFLRQDGIELTDEESEELIKYCKLKDLADHSTETSLATATANAKELDESFKDLVDKVLDEPRKDDFLAIYQRYNENAPPAIAAEPSAGPPPGFEVHRVSDDLWQQGEDAIKVLVGSILEELEKKGSNN
ncbi:hypothetical protein MKX07_003222 [Trichoderma sp. CBMAI-0711]|nr:hypothetical protein MKX07_003222 [Trichoderma sp. CBMAI-0711]